MTRNRKRPRPHTVRSHTRKGSGVNAYPRGSGSGSSSNLPPKVDSKTKGKRWETSAKEKLEGAVNELTLWSDNDQQTYRHKIALALNYYRKKKRGIFNEQRALEGVANLHVPRIIKAYKRETGLNDIYGYQLTRMPKAHKMLVAKEILPGIMEQVEWYEKHPEDYAKDKRRH